MRRPAQSRDSTSYLATERGRDSIKFSSYGPASYCSYITFESAGLVENLSFFSPWSSYSCTMRSTVHTANFLWFGAQATAATLAAPFCRGGEKL